MRRLHNIKKWGGFLFLCLLLVGFVLPVVPVDAAQKRVHAVFTKEEQEYMKKAGTITVALSPDNFPYSTIETGEMTGIFPELLQMISEETGLEIQILPCETYKDYSILKKNREADIVFATHVDKEEAKADGYQLTSSYFTVSYSKMELRENKAQNSRVAVLEQPSAEATQAEKYYYSDQIIYCNSKQECLRLLDEYACDAVIINSYEAELMQYSDIKNQYVVKELFDNQIRVAAGVRLDENPLLYGIIEKVLTSIDGITKEEIISRNTQKPQETISFIKLLYMNPIFFIAALLVFFTLICGMIFLVFRVKKSNLAQKQTEEFRRFMGYICAAVDAVTELNIKDRIMTRYTLKDGVIVEEREPYPKNEWLMFHPEDRGRMITQCSEENLKKICAENRTIYEECRMRWNHSEEYHWCTAILQGIYPSKEKPFHLLLLLKDTTQLKENEARQRQALEDALKMAKQASESKGSFLSNMSHEIRTPLNAMIGYLGLARESDIQPKKLAHCLDNCEVASKHLLQIINDILDMSSIETGKLKLAHEDFDLKKEIMDLTTIFFQNAKLKGVIFETHVENMTEEWVRGDSLRLNQILMNLLSNAVKFTPEKGLVQLRIRQRNEDEEKVYFQFLVSDTGIGLSKEYMSRIFQPFEQENAGTAKKFGGSGLGLSITNNLVRMMGGTITVESQQKEGTTFAVTLYFEKSEKNKEKGERHTDYSHVRVLIVDDKEDEGAYIKTMLKRCGVKSDFVTTGEKALKRLKSRMEGDYPYNLCIIDWNMPNMDGGEVTKRIRRELGEEIPIIIATAYDITEFEETAREAGANTIVAKPLFQSTLFDILVSTFGEYNPSVHSKREEKTMDMTGMHLLLAEDNPMNMDIAVTVLEKAGIVVDQAVNGEEAYEMFTSQKAGTYQLILMDVQMPILDGYEATRKIRSSSHSEAATIPIIAMTANAFAEDVAQALANGMNAHIAKPINYDKLFQVLAQFSI